MIRNCIFLLILFIAASTRSFSQIVLETDSTESLLYLGKGGQQPLIVGLGGSEGGNAWSSDYWKPTRDRFIEKGYAFLAIGYFGAKGTPLILNRIELENVHRAILAATRNKQVDQHKIAIIGGSRGADLALLLGSYYSDISCVVSIVGSHAVFPGHTSNFTTSCWTYRGKELPFVPVNEAAVPFMEKRSLRGAFEAMLQDTAAERKALIPVERIKGPVLLLSAKQDRICPSTPMAEKIMARLKENNFRFHTEHVAIEGGHTAPLQHFDLIFTFLEQYFAPGHR